MSAIYCGYSSSNKPNNGGGGTVSAAAAEDTRQRNFTIGRLQDQITQLDAAIGNLAGYESSGLNQINDGYSKGTSRLNQQRSNALTRYNTQREDTRGDFDDASGDIDLMARSNYMAISNFHQKTTPRGGNFSENPNLARSTGFEPAISSVTGRRDNPFTTSARWLLSSKHDSSLNRQTQEVRGVLFLTLG